MCEEHVKQQQEVGEVAKVEQEVVPLELAVGDEAEGNEDEELDGVCPHEVLRRAAQDVAVDEVSSTHTARIDTCVALACI